MTGGGPARLIRVHGWWIVLVTIVVTTGAWAVARTAPTEYTSAAIVVVESRVRANTTPVAPDMGTEKQLAQSGLVVDPAARALGLGQGELLDGLAVSVAADANVLTFSYTHAVPSAAQSRAQALAQAYVDYRNDGNGSSQHATLVTDAWLPGVPDERPVALDVGLGVVVGLTLGVATALLRDRLSDRLRGRDDLGSLIGTPVLAAVPVQQRFGRVPPEPVLLRDPSSPAAEAFRYLRSRVQPLLPATVLVTSADAREGRTTVAANLAVALAQAGNRVILVDADLRHPGLGAAFGTGDGPGLSDVLAGTVVDALRDGPLPGLRLLTAGTGAAGAADLLGSARLGGVLRELRGRCDAVVVDCAPVLRFSDPLVLAGTSDQVLLVGDLRRSTRRGVARARAELVAGGVRALDAVLLNAPGGAPSGRAAALTPVPGAPDREAGAVTVPIPLQSVSATGRRKPGPGAL